MRHCENSCGTGIFPSALTSPNLRRRSHLRLRSSLHCCSTLALAPRVLAVMSRFLADLSQEPRAHTGEEVLKELCEGGLLCPWSVASAIVVVLRPVLHSSSHRFRRCAHVQAEGRQFWRGALFNVPRFRLLQVAGGQCNCGGDMISAFVRISCKRLPKPQKRALSIEHHL